MRFHFYIKHNTHYIYIYIYIYIYMCVCVFMICLVGTAGYCNVVYMVLQRNNENKGLSDRNY